MSPRQVDPPALPPAADPITPPRSADLSASPWLLPQLHQIPLSLQLHQAPSSPRLCLGQTSPCLCHGLTTHPLRSISPFGSTLPPSLQSHQVCLSPQAPWLHRTNGVARSHLLTFWAQGSSTIIFVYISHPPRCHQASLHHGSCLCRLRLWLSSCLLSGSPPDSSCSWLLLSSTPPWILPVVLLSIIVIVYTTGSY